MTSAYELVTKNVHNAALRVYLRDVMAAIRF